MGRLRQDIEAVLDIVFKADSHGRGHSLLSNVRMYTCYYNGLNYLCALVRFSSTLTRLDVLFLSARRRVHGRHAPARQFPFTATVSHENHLAFH